MKKKEIHQQIHADIELFLQKKNKNGCRYRDITILVNRLLFSIFFNVNCCLVFQFDDSKYRWAYLTV